MGNFIGIDLGTSSVKLVLTDDQGKVLREAGESYSSFSLDQAGRRSSRILGGKLCAEHCRRS